MGKLYNYDLFIIFKVALKDPLLGGARGGLYYIYN
jgi:hypothetical protein